MKPYELPCYHWLISLKNELYFQSFSSEELNANMVEAIFSHGVVNFKKF